MSNRTFTMIKPDATRKADTGAILDQIVKAGFTIKAMKWTKLTKEQAGLFYDVHRERPFYGELVDFMSSGPIVAAILENRLSYLIIISLIVCLIKLARIILSIIAITTKKKERFN